MNSSTTQVRSPLGERAISAFRDTGEHLGRDRQPGLVTVWEPELEELARRTELVHGTGGEEKVERHRAQGELTVRERIDALLDPGTFHEIVALTGRATYEDDDNFLDVTPANFVMGCGGIDDWPVVIRDDPTVRGRRRRRLDPPEAGARGAHGTRPAHADRASVDGPATAAR